MDGPEVFSFASREVPGLVEETLTAAGWSKESLDLLVLHQANKFLLDHIRRKVKIPVEKMPLSLERFGNTSSASIPVTLTKHGGGGSLSGNLLLAGFGVGLSWAAAACTFDRVRILPFLSLSSAESSAATFS